MWRSTSRHWLVCDDDRRSLAARLVDVTLIRRGSLAEAAHIAVSLVPSDPSGNGTYATSLRVQSLVAHVLVGGHERTMEPAERGRGFALLMVC